MRIFKPLFNFVFFINCVFFILFIFNMSLYGLTQYTFIIQFWEIDTSFTIKFTSAQFIIVAIAIAVILITASVNVVSSGLNDSGVKIIGITIVYFLFMSLFIVITSQYFNTFPFVNNFVITITAVIFGMDYLFRIGGLYNE